jgi:heat shock protein HslJ
MKTKLPIIALMATMLVSCQTIPDAEPPVGSAAPYKALGTEPFWSLTIDGNNMAFKHEAEVTASDAKARPSFNGWRYTSSKINADVTFTPCSDGMSEYTYKDTVTVIVGEKEYNGCGGGILPPDTLERTEWRVQSIDGAEIPVERNATIKFADGRMSGSVGCNRMGGSYMFTDKTLSLGPVMATKMGCPDPIGRQEQAFASILGTVASTTFPGDGTMVLTGKEGSKVVLMQLM